jgi:Protein of unknown function (DUF3105)
MPRPVAELQKRAKRADYPAMARSVRRPPAGALAALLIVLALGPVGLAVLGRKPAPTAPRVDTTLAAIARAGGCRLIEYDRLRATNPTTGGRVVNEQITAAAGSYVGRRPPSVRAALHALMHGAVLVQYRPGLRKDELVRLAALAPGRRGQTLVFANTTNMRPQVAATAYLSMLTCQRADAGALRALRVFRERRAAFGQAF